MVGMLEKSPASIPDRASIPQTACLAKLETKRRAQVHDAAIVADASGGADVTRTVHYAEGGAEDIRVRDAPARMVQNVTEAGEQLQPHSLHHANVLENRRVPRKGVAIANEK